MEIAWPDRLRKYVRRHGFATLSESAPTDLIEDAPTAFEVDAPTAFEDDAPTAWVHTAGDL